MTAYIRVDVAYALILDAVGERVLTVLNETAWSLPGGAREPGEMLSDAAIREVREETGLDVVVYGVVQIAEKFLDPHHALFVTFLGEIAGGEIGTSDGEIQRIEWKTFAEAKRLIPYLRDIPALVRSPADYQRG